MDRGEGEDMGDATRGCHSQSNRISSYSGIDPHIWDYGLPAATTTLFAPNDFVIRFVLSEEDFAK